MGMRIKATITYEYDVVPAHYGPDWGDAREPTPTEMAKMDIETDPAAMLMGDDYHISAVEIFPGYTDAGVGCSRCGCRNAVIECEGLCVLCHEKERA
jgi:hypothetical protein